MADTEVIKSFLVDLGYRVDESQTRKWDNWLVGATKGVLAFAAAAAASAVAVKSAVVSMSDGLEQLYWASQRTKSSAENLRAFGFAASQMGSSVEGALGSVEAFASFLRSSPGASSLVRSLGVSTTENGRLRDTADVMQDLGRAFKGMDFYVAKQYGQLMGIDERTLMALTQGLGQFSDQYKRFASDMRVNLPRAAESAHSLMNEARSLGTVFSLLGTKIVGGVTDRIARDIERLRKWIVSNSERIAWGVEKAIAVVLALADGIARLATRGGEAVQSLIRWFDGLSPRAREIATAAAWLAGAWAAVNLAFAASPITRILLLATAVATLWDDYKTWKEGGDSLIDWAKWEPQIQAAIKGLEAIGKAIDAGVQMVGGWENAFTLLLAFVAGKWALGMIAAAGRVGSGMLLGLLAPLARIPAGVLGLLGLGPLVGFLAGMFPGSTQTTEQEYAEPGGAEIQRNWSGMAGGQQAKGQQAMDYFMSQGWTREQAAGIVANLEAESGFDHSIVGDGGKAFGIAQWHPDRQANFRRAFGKDIKDSTYAEQLAFVQWELTNTEKGAGDALRATQGSGQAASAISRLYERPADADGEAAKRARASHAWLRQPDPAPAVDTSSVETALERLRSGNVLSPSGAMAPPAPSAANSNSVVINQENSVVVQGVSDPAGNADRVGAVQDRNNAELMRNFQRPVR